MGLLKATYGGVEIPVKITRLDRNLSPSITNNTRSIENVNGGEFTHSTYSTKQIVMEFRISNSTARELSEFRRKMSEILYSKEPKRLIFPTNQAFTMKQSWMGNRCWERMICTALAQSHAHSGRSSILYRRILL